MVRIDELPYELIKEILDDDLFFLTSLVTGISRRHFYKS